MKLLQAFSEAFNATPPNGNIRLFLIEQCNKVGCETFSYNMFNWFGGRAYNEFLDYGLCALKFHNLFQNKYRYLQQDDFVTEIINRLLFDDRHDLYQNAPYYLKDLYELNKNKQKELKDFWKDVSVILIDCFNENGTGDVSHKNCLV